MGKGKLLQASNHLSRPERAVAEADGVVRIEVARQGFRVVHVFPRASTEETRSHIQAFRRDAVRLLLREDWG